MNPDIERAFLAIDDEIQGRNREIGRLQELRASMEKIFGPYPYEGKAEEAPARVEFASEGVKYAVDMSTSNRAGMSESLMAPAVAALKQPRRSQGAKKSAELNKFKSEVGKRSDRKTAETVMAALRSGPANLVQLVKRVEPDAGTARVDELTLRFYEHLMAHRELYARSPGRHSQWRLRDGATLPPPPDKPAPSLTARTVPVAGAANAQEANRALTQARNEVEAIKDKVNEAVAAGKPTRELENQLEAALDRLEKIREGKP